MSLTNVIIAINVAVFLWQLATGAGLQPGHYDGMLIGAYVLQRGEWYRIVTSAFEHGSLIHIGMNMLALFQVGNLVEQLFGKTRFVLLYALALTGSGIAVVYATPLAPTLGASGAIFGLFGALVAAGLREGARGRGLVGQVLPIILINLVFTFAVPGISAAAHVGGLLTGFAAGLLLYMMRRPPREPAYAYAYAPANEPGVETIEHPPHAGAHEDEDGPPPHLRDPDQ